MKPNRIHMHQNGSYLLEALTAILLFALGILGLVGLLTNSLRASSDARYRTEAASIATAMVAAMWTMSSSEMSTQFGRGGAQLGDWQAKVAALLPAGTAGVDLTEPALSSQSRAAVITIGWQLPGSSERRNYVMTAQIGRNPR